MLRIKSAYNSKCILLVTQQKKSYKLTFLYFRGHSSRCGSPSRNTRREVKAVLRENVLETWARKCDVLEIWECEWEEMLPLCVQELFDCPMWNGTVNSFPASSVFRRLLITSADSLDLNQG